jgi:hypothetical protein
MAFPLSSRQILAFLSTATLWISSTVHALPAGEPSGARIWDWRLGWVSLPVTNAIAGSAGSYCALLLTSDGSIVPYGDPDSQFVKGVPQNLTNVVAAEAGGGYGLALKADGTVVSWGANLDGAANLPPGLSNIVAVSAGSSHALALRNDGTVIGWGVLKPLTNLSDVVAIKAGYASSMALKRDGNVVAWGREWLPTGPRDWQNSGPPGTTNIIAIASGAFHHMALRADGMVVAWGGGGYNEADVPPGLTNAIAITAGHVGSYALTREGKIVAWGAELPLGINGMSNILSISAGSISFVARTHEPLILKQPVARSVPGGSDVEFAVDVISSRQPWSYQWRFDRTPIPGATNAVLQLTNVHYPAIGDYRVTISNSVGVTESVPARLNIFPNPPVISAETTSFPLLAGQDLFISTTLTGAAPITLQWYLDGIALATETNAVLQASPISKLDSGIYDLVATNLYGSTSARFFVNVSLPPTNHLATEQLTLPAGTSVVARARVLGDSPLSYQWTLNGTNIPGATYPSFVISNLQSFAQFYSVTVSNSFGVVTNTPFIFLITNTPPQFVEQPGSQLIRLGDVAALKPDLLGSEPLALYWSRNGTALPDETNLLLRIPSFSPADAGSYTLTASNAFGVVVSSNYTLTVGNPYTNDFDWPTLGWTPLITNKIDRITSIVPGPAESDQLFITEQKGSILKLSDGVPGTEPFLDIQDRTLLGFERGLLGLAFPTNFPARPHFYVNYTRQTDGATIVSRFRLSTPEMADPASEQVLLTIPQPFPNHNGGQLAFGPDGYLYIGLGDGGYAPNGQGDPQNHAQNPKSLLGKILRLDVESDTVPYGIPITNPFITNTNYAPEIWALGLRNPWRFSFDALSGDLYIGDVGHNRVEEIDFQSAISGGGKNYGWPFYEGTLPYRGFTNGTTFIQPVDVFTGSRGRGSVTGGYVNRFNSEIRLNGTYVFGDFVSGRIYGLLRLDQKWNRKELAATPFPISTFGQSSSGDLYFAHYATNGGIYRLIDTRVTHSPTFLTLIPGIHSQDILLPVVSGSPGAFMTYTTDGRDPTEFDARVLSGDSIPITGNYSLKIRSFRPDLAPSVVVQLSNAFTFVAAAPEFTPSSENPLSSGSLVSISSKTPNATIYYTLDGTTPTRRSPRYSGPVRLAAPTILSAIAIRDGYLDSPVSNASYYVQPVVNPINIAIAHNTNEILIRLTADPSARAIIQTAPALGDQISWTPFTTDPLILGPDGVIQISVSVTNTQRYFRALRQP